MEKQLIIQKSEVKPSRKELSVLGVFNPAVITKGNETIMIVRVAETASGAGQKTILVPTYQNRTIRFVEIDRFSNDFDFSDARLIRNHEQNYLTSISHFRIARSDDGVHFVFDSTRIMPETAYESYGIEDPRITDINGLFYITYSAISEYGINVALMVTKDFCTFDRLGIILPFDNKDCVIFPKMINGNYYAFHRPSKSDFGHLDIWLAKSPDLLHWGDHQVMVQARPNYQNSARVGAGAVPFLTKRGWVVIYHAADANHRYHLAALLLDADNPNKILMRSKKPLLEPKEDYERNGFFKDVVFTCGLTKNNEQIHLYYGVCDENIAMATMSLTEIFANMEEVSYEKS
ncbi:MAG: glycoside hydrolase family 130 protein [Bacilli bacterium]|nr:glycoside hydrolase family 130 protein [Bacilli bacterium]